MSITLKLDLPEKLAAEARANGLLESASLTGLLEEELRRRRAANEFHAMLSVIREQPGAAPAEREIQTEVDAVRKSVRGSENCR